MDSVTLFPLIINLELGNVVAVFIYFLPLSSTNETREFHDKSKFRENLLIYILIINNGEDDKQNKSCNDFVCIQ